MGSSRLKAASWPLRAPGRFRSEGELWKRLAGGIRGGGHPAAPPRAAPPPASCRHRPPRAPGSGSPRSAPGSRPSGSQALTAEPRSNTAGARLQPRGALLPRTPAPAPRTSAAAETPLGIPATAPPTRLWFLQFRRHNNKEVSSQAYGRRNALGKGRPGRPMWLPSGADLHQWWLRWSRRRGGEIRGLEARRGPGPGGAGAAPHKTAAGWRGTAASVCVDEDLTAKIQSISLELDCFSLVGKGGRLISGWFFRFWALSYYLRRGGQKPWA